MKAAVAIFVKTPGRSPIKTRLAESLGRSQAEACYRLSAQCVAESVADAGLIAYWAVAEEDQPGASFWDGFPRIAQGEGSLGRRMAQVHSDLVARHGAAILVGGDLPQIRPSELRQAGDWLASDAPRQSLGAARDGGFWLYGSNRKHSAKAWESVPYSTAETADRFVAAIGVGEWQMLPTRTDLDRDADLEPVLHELRALDPAGRSQRQMIEWLERCLERVA